MGPRFFGKVALVTLGVGFVLAPSDLLCDFSFPSYARFREGNPADAPKSLPPPHSALWGHRLPVTALALSARRPFGPARFARGLDNFHNLQNCNQISECQPNKLYYKLYNFWWGEAHILLTVRSIF